MCKMFCKFQQLVARTFAFLTVAEIAKAADLDWWKHAVFYQIYPRSFMDSNGDGVGDINGIIKKLDFLNETGVTAIWLSPIYKSPQIDQGYDISDFEVIDPIYGNQTDFDNLVSGARARGIKIVMDFVPNHSSDEHEWFTKSKNNVSGFGDYYIWKDGTSGNNTPNNWISAFKDSAWSYNADRKQFYLHQFSRQQPDLNYGSPAVVDAMKKVLTHWLNLGVYGFRMDAVPFLFEDSAFRNESLSNIPGVPATYPAYLRHVYTQNLPETFDMIYEWRALLDSYNTSTTGGEPRIMMTEVYADIENTMYYYGNEKQNGSHFTFNFFLITDLNSSSNARDVVSTIEKWLKNMPTKYTANWVLGNHDNHRVATRLGPENVDSYNMLNALLPGIMVTYNGEEIGQENGEVTYADGQDPNACSAGEDDFASLSRDFERTPYHWDNSTHAGFSTANKTWLPVSKKHIETNLEAQKDSNVQSHYQIYKQLVKLRRETTFKYGKLQIRAVTDNVVVFSRSLTGNNTYVVILNLSPKTASIAIDKEIFAATTYLEVVIPNGKSSRKKGDLISTTKLQLKEYESLVAVSTTRIPDTTTPSPSSTTTTSSTSAPTTGGVAALTNHFSILLLTLVCVVIITGF